MCHDLGAVEDERCPEEEIRKEDLLRPSKQKGAGNPIPKQFLESNTELDESDFEECAALTEGFSCSDIVSIARDAQMEPVRRIQRATHFKKVREEYHGHPLRAVFFPIWVSSLFGVLCKLVEIIAYQKSSLIMRANAPE